MDFPQKPSSTDDTGDATATSFPGAVWIGAWSLLVCALVSGVVIAQEIGNDLYVRTHWPIVYGDVVKAQAKSTRVSSRDRSPTLFWVEFEVEFDPKDAGCNTGMNWAAPTRFPCIGNVRSPDSSWGTPFDWIRRHPPNSSAKFYYDPKTGQLRFAGESIFDTYPWGTIAFFLFTGCAAMWLFGAFHRLKPANITVIKSSTEDALTELKLS
jgi:hypothetical protein